MPVGQDPKEALPNTAFGPSHKAVVDGRWWAILRRTVAPAATTPNDMDDPADHSAIIHALLTAHVGWKKRINLTPLFIAKPKQIAAHRLSPNHFIHSESATDSRYNDSIGFGP